ncbi:unnamed protein product [Pylaiella littoralis]
MTVSTDSTAFAGVSSAALKKVHLQRLLAFAVALVACTLASWQLMIACWAITPFTPDRDSGILRDFLSILVVSFFHILAAFSRYLVCDADDSPRHRRRRRSSSSSSSTAGGPGRRGGGRDFSYSALALPNLGQGLATVVAHGLIGMSLGLYAWNIVAARAGELSEGSGALGGVVAGGVICSIWSSLSFLKKRRHHLRFGLPRGAALPSHLRGEACGSAKEGLVCGAVLATVYLVLRVVGELLPSSLPGRSLVMLLGLPAAAAPDGPSGEAFTVVVVDRAGRLAVTYLVFLSTAVNFGLHGFLSKMMNLIIVAPQDFLRLWQASVAAVDSQGAGEGAGAPSSPAAMLLDALSIGHETVLHPAEKAFLEARGLPVDTGGGAASRVSSYTRAGPMDNWADETDLQRRALALSCVEPPRTGRRGEGGGGKMASTRGVVVPVWAQVAKAQALRSLALKAPCDKDLRAALYEVNIAQVLRTLCLELDEASLLLQISAFREDPAEAARALGCEGRGDIQWLVGYTASSSSPGEASRGWLNWLKDGLSPPFRGTVYGLLAALRPLFSSGEGGGRGRGRGDGGGGAGRRGARGAKALSPARLQSAIWAAQGMSALMVRALGESRIWSLDTMLPVVLGSLAGLLLAVQQPDGYGGGGGDGGDGGEQQQQQQQQQDEEEEQQRGGRRGRELEAALEKALTEVATKYRSCLPDFRFPPVYAETINRLLEASS